MTFWGLTFEQLALIFSLLTGTNLISALITVFNARASRRSLESQSSNNYSQAVNQYIEALAKIGKEVNDLRTELGRLRGEIGKRDQMIDHLNELLAQKNMTIEDLRDWAERLVTQFETHVQGVEPEKLNARDRIAYFTPIPNDEFALSADADIPTVKIEKHNMKPEGVKQWILNFITKIVSKLLQI